MSPEFNFIVKANLKDSTAARRMQDAMSAFNGVEEVWIAESKILGGISENTDSTNNLEVTPVDGVKKLTYGEVIEAWRNHQGMNMTDLARRAGVSQPYITQVELNRIKRPSDDKLEQIARGLGIDSRILLLRNLPPQDDSDS